MSSLWRTFFQTRRMEREPTPERMPALWFAKVVERRLNIKTEAVMLKRSLLHCAPACALFLLLSLPGLAHERWLPGFTCEVPVPVAYHAGGKNVLEVYKRFVCFTARPTEWRTLLFVEACGLRNIATRLHLRPASDTPLSESQHSYKQVPADSWVYPALERLQQQGWAQVVTPCCGYGRTITQQRFTRYEMAVLLQRADARFVRRSTDPYTGVEWEWCGLPLHLSRESAHDLLDLNMQFMPELQAIGAPRQQTERLIRTLEAYLRK